jgi:hypothetical protein
MQEKDGQTQRIRGNKNTQDVRTDSHWGENVERVGAGVGNQPLATDRENSSSGIATYDPLGGVLDQLIDDAEKQWVKSQECIVWYQQEAQEYKQKLDKLRKLKELQQQQQQQQTLTAATESFNHSGENLAE